MIHGKQQKYASNERQGVEYVYGGFRAFCGYEDSVRIPTGFSVGMGWVYFAIITT